jgi:hypothetical protein
MGIWKNKKMVMIVFFFCHVKKALGCVCGLYWNWPVLGFALSSSYSGYQAWPLA